VNFGNNLITLKSITMTQERKLLESIHMSVNMDSLCHLSKLATVGLVRMEDTESNIVDFISGIIIGVKSNGESIKFLNEAELDGVYTGYIGNKYVGEREIQIGSGKGTTIGSLTYDLMVEHSLAGILISPLWIERIDLYSDGTFDCLIGT